MLVPGDLRGDQPVEGRPTGSSGGIARDAAVDVAGDDENERAGRASERGLDAGSVEQAEGDVQRFTVASVVVVVDVPCVHDGADPELALAPVREAGVISGQQ